MDQPELSMDGLHVSNRVGYTEQSKRAEATQLVGGSSLNNSTLFLNIAYKL
ncbi:MAG: hypothetical protein ACFFCD_07420 [Promethearchaeota archaeon]